jgi:hypothetical protein
MWLVMDTLELSGTSDSFRRAQRTQSRTNNTINTFMTLCDNCPYFFRLPRSGSDNSYKLSLLCSLETTCYSGTSDVSPHQSQARSLPAPNHYRHLITRP